MRLTRDAILHIRDADAALYWLGRMLVAGEEPLYIARRLIRMASEDIGMGDSSALPLVCTESLKARALSVQRSSHSLTCVFP